MDHFLVTTNDNNEVKFYVGDFYMEDLKYLSPKVLCMQTNIENKTEQSKNNMTSKLLWKLWFKEVLRGLRQFLYDGSLHGVKYIFEPSFNRIERYAWIIIMLIITAIWAGNIIQLFCKWTSTPFVNVIDSLPTPIWAVPFPTVVLCPHLHLKLSYANVSKLNNLETFFSSLVCPHMSGESNAKTQRLSPEDIKMFQDFITMSSPNCKDVVKSCYWRPISYTKWLTDECCDRLFRPIFTNYGLCFAFNSLPLNGMTKETVSWQKTFNPDVQSEFLEWGLDTGYPKTFPPDPTTRPFRVMASGEMNGLGVELYLNMSDHQYDCEGNSMGFNLLISSPADHVYTSTVLRLPMNKMTTVEVSPITYKTDLSLSSLQPNKRQCFFQNEKRLDYYEFYTDSNCKQDLLIRETKRTCNCVLFNWPRINVWETICSTAVDFQCVTQVKAAVEEKLIYAYYADSEEETHPHGESSTSCHPSCNDVLYLSQVFYSDLIKESEDRSPEWGLPKPGETTRINVHFYNDKFLGQHRHAQYDDYYFAGAVGGLLSLFLGFSIISVAEFIYFVIFRPIYLLILVIYYP